MQTGFTVPLPEKRIASNGVFGMIFVLATEAMFFAGLISAYMVNRANEMMLPPAGQPRLPVEATALNTLVLLASAYTLYRFRQKYMADGSVQGKSTSMLITSIALGVIFLAVQGSEWLRLISFGLTTHSSIYGAFFYTLIGLHGVHVLAGILILLYLWYTIKGLKSHEDAGNRIAVCSMYWYFVVAVWPVLYYLVYLS